MPRFAPIVELALGATLTGNPNTWSWTDVSRYVHEPSAISIVRGRRDRYSEASPDTCALNFINNDGRFVPRNPLGPYYGTLTRNTPLRVLVVPQTNSLRDAFGRTSSSSWGTADSGGAWTVVGTAADYSVSTTNGGRHTNPSASVRHVSLQSLSIVRSDQKVRIRVNATSTGAAQSAGLICRYIDASNHFRGEIQFGTTGTMTLRAVDRNAGVDVAVSEVLTLTHSASTWYWLRLQTGLTSIRIKAWQDGTTEPATWQIDGADGVGPANPVAGTLGCHSMRETGNTNANATTDFDDWSMIDGPRIQFTGFVDSWPTRWADASLNQAYAPITASGQLRRLSRVGALRSAIFRANTSTLTDATPTVVGYWPMEDGSTATTFASGIGGPASPPFTDVRLAADSAVVGSEPLPILDGTGRISFQVPAYTPTGTWAVRWVMKIPASSISAAAQVMSWITPGGSIVRWQFTLTPGAPDTGRLDGFTSSGSVVSSAAFNLTDSTSGAELTDGRQLIFEVNATQNGGNIDYDVGASAVPDDGSLESLGVINVGVGGSTAGTLANVRYVYHDAPNGFANGGHTIGHVGVGTDIAFGPNSIGVTGGATETTDFRFTALLGEQGITPYFGDLIRGGGSTSQKLGPQRLSDVLSQLREIEATELGVLYDGKQGFVHLLPRTMRYNRTVDLTLDVDQHQVGWPFEPNDDDYLLRNDVTVSNAGGSSARATDPTSIALQGVHADTATVNVYKDSDLPGHAAWRLTLGLSDDLRFPAIVIDLTRNHLALATAWCDTDIGSRIQITNVPATELPPEDLDLVLDGYTEEISSTQWKVTANVSPGRSWLVEQLDSDRRLDCGACVTAEALDTTETGVDVAISDRCVWTHASGNYDIVIGGERMRVTAVSAAAGAGSSWTQTLTVTRSINGIVKSHSTGAEVHVADPIILAL